MKSGSKACPFKNGSLGFSLLLATANCQKLWNAAGTTNKTVFARRGKRFIRLRETIEQ
jgi:hypothetical protein